MPDDVTNHVFIRSFNQLSKAAHTNARQKGFWSDADAIQHAAECVGLGDAARKMRGAQLNALIASEVGEALEGLRKDIPSDKLPGFTNEEEEYADAIIRILDMACARGMRIAEAVVLKMEVNAGRPHRHGGKSF